MESRRSKYRMSLRGPISKYLLFQKERREMKRSYQKINSIYFSRLKNKHLHNKKDH